MKDQIDRNEYCKNCDRSIFATGELAGSCDTNIVNGQRDEKYPWEK